ncbi:tetratricopeptide repeat protein [Streptomyces niveus]|uniref:XRE family transcriptional regulator n=1 Tax=Streptomyces niveus TaxID=193462 RepID=UPI0036EF6682
MPSGELAAATSTQRDTSPPVSQGEPIPTPLALEGTALVRTVADESAAWAAWAEGSNVGSLALEQLLADIRSLASAYLVEDPVAVFIRTRQLRDRVFRVLEGHQHPKQSVELYVAAGYLCALLAWMSSDFGHLREAETNGRTAWLCAELAGHNELRAWVLSTRSKIAFWDNRIKDAINHARLGASYQTPGSVAVLLACQEADAWSLLGAAAETQEALRSAVDARVSAAGVDEISGVFSCPPIRHANYASSAYLRAGDLSAALRTGEEAIHTLRSHSHGTTAQTHIALALTYLRLGQLDGAAEALDPVLAIPPAHRLAPVTRRMRDLAGELGSRALRSGVGADLQLRIQTWCADSVALSPETGST